MSNKADHRGAIVEQVLRKNNVNLTKLARQLNIHRSTLYNYFSYPKLDWDMIMDISKIISYDFAKEFPELRSQFSKDAASRAEEPIPDYARKDLFDKCLHERDLFMRMYMEVNEKYIALNEKYLALLEAGK